MELEDCVTDAYEYMTSYGRWEIEATGRGRYVAIKGNTSVTIFFNYLLNDTRLSLEDQTHLQCEALRLYFTERKQKNITTPTMNGKIQIGKSFTVLGTFAGPEYIANVETKHGKSEIHMIGSFHESKKLSRN